MTLISGGAHLPLRAALAAARPRNTMSARKYLPDREPALLRRYARHVDRGLTSCKPDVVIAADTLPVCYSTTTVPIAIWNDATIAGLLGYYPGFVELSPRTITNAERAERAALSRATVFAGASDWAVATARAQPTDPPPSPVVVPFGANLEIPRPPKPRRGPRSARLLTIGTDWHRKGVDIAIAISDELRARGMPAELDVVGCRPPRRMTLGEHVHLHGFVDKGTAGGRAELTALFERADIYLMPSRAECFGITYCEAAAHGLPSVGTRTGGTESAVQDGATGILLDPDDAISVYADTVERLLNDSALYSHLSDSARHRYETVLNWPAACATLAAHLRTVGAL